LRSTTNRSRGIPGAALLALAGCLLLAAPSAAQTGGAAPPPEAAPPPVTTPGSVAKLKKNGKAIAPANAPIQVQNAIAAANRIRKKPYIYGGGHKSFDSKGYDCSGAVSYVLHAAGLLESPLPSGPLMKWGSPGKGAWISVYANAGHTYAMIAGLRWDTSAVNEPVNNGSGPRWRATKRKAAGYTVRHADGL
jgi:hypothetical protein